MDQDPNLGTSPLAAAALPPESNSGLNLPLETQPAKSSRVLLFVYIAIAVVVLAAGGVYFYTVYAKNTPEKIWSAYSATLKSDTVVQDPTYHLDANFNLATVLSTGLDGDTTDQELNIKLGLSSDIDNTDANHPKSSSVANASIGSGALSYNINNLQFMQDGPVWYLNVNNIPYANSFVDKKYNGWIKIDTDSQQFKSLGAVQSPQTESQQFQDLLKNSNVVTGHQFIAKENVAGIATYHYKVILNKDALKQLLKDELNKNKQQTGSQAILNETLQSQSFDFYSDPNKLDAFLDRTTVNNSDVWLASQTGKPVKFSLAIQMPVPKPPKIDSFSDSLYSQQQAKTMAGVATALELYYNDNNGYPVSFAALAPKYLNYIPPVQAGAKCTAAGFSLQQPYRYQPLGSGFVNSKQTIVYPNYNLSFCLDADTSSLKAGVYVYSPSGVKQIQSFEQPASTNPDDLFLPGKATNFSADLTISKGPAHLTVNIPTQAYDIFNGLSDAGGAAAPNQQNLSDQTDQQRVDQIREVATALELFYNDNASYPVQKSPGPIPFALAPTYIPSIPKAPAVQPGNAGRCTAQNNDYVYTSFNGLTYTLTFCLGSTTGGYPAGPHTLSPVGIQ